MSILLSLIVIYVLLWLSGKISNYFNSNHYFISIPYIATVLLFLGFFLSYRFFSITYIFDPFIERVLISVFLFSIGFQISNVFTKLYIKRLLILMGISSIVLLFLHGIELFFIDELSWLVGSTMFAFNEEFINRVITDQDQRSLIYFWSKVQMSLIFFLTPIFLLLVSYLHPKAVTDTFNKSKDIISFKGSYSFGVIFISVLAVYIKNEWLTDRIPFLFDFVFTMALGLLLGFWSKTKLTNNKKMKLNQQFHQIGTFGLYSFIVTTIYSVIFTEVNLFSWGIFLVLVVKTIIVATLTVLVILLLFKKLTYYESIVAMIAGWTFILNAPVTCMHGMRTAVNKFGPVPNVLLIVPPVILWLVNYIHWLVYLL